MNEQRIVCAAMRNEHGVLVCGVRHWDHTMHASGKGGWEQGFVDNRGKFLTREEAWPIAVAAQQIRQRVGGDEGRLFSENLY